MGSKPTALSLSSLCCTTSSSAKPATLLIGDQKSSVSKSAISTPATKLKEIIAEQTAERNVVARQTNIKILTMISEALLCFVDVLQDQKEDFTSIGQPLSRLYLETRNLFLCGSLKKLPFPPTMVIPTTRQDTIAWLLNIVSLAASISNVCKTETVQNLEFLFDKTMLFVSEATKTHDTNTERETSLESGNQQKRIALLATVATMKQATAT